MDGLVRMLGRAEAAAPAHNSQDVAWVGQARERNEQEIGENAMVKVSELVGSPSSPESKVSTTANEENLRIGN